MNKVIDLSSKQQDVQNDDYRLDSFLSSKLRECDFVEVTHKPKKLAPDAIKKREDIDAIKNYYIENGKYRDHLIFTIGIGCGVRAGDLMKFRFGTLLQPNGTGGYNIRKEFYILEEKTTKPRAIFVSLDMVEALKLYLSHMDRDVDLNSYLFESEAGHKKEVGSKRKGAFNPKTGLHREIQPDTGMAVESVSYALRVAVKKLNLNYHVASHTLRKTFAYHYLTEHGDSERALENLQYILNHASRSDTLKYIGITNSEIRDHCLNLYTGKKLYSEVMKLIS